MSKRNPRKNKINEVDSFPQRSNIFHDLSKQLPKGTLDTLVEKLGLPNNRLFGDYSGTSLDDALAGFHQNELTQVPGITSGLDDFLKGYGPLASTERTDQLIQYILEMISKNDQRLYDQKVLNEQRQYDSPTNQLARLMGAGISRDAAIQLLNSAGGSSGSSALIGSGSNISAPAVSAPSGTAENQRMNVIFGGVAEMVNMISNLALQGISLANGIQQYQFQKSQNIMSQEQLDGYQSANQLSQMLQVLDSQNQFGDQGLSQFDNFEQVAKYMWQNKSTNQSFEEVVSSDYFKKATGTIFGRDFMNNNWMSRVASRNAGTQVMNAVRNQELSNDVLSATREKISAECSVLAEETQLINAQTKGTLQQLAESQMRVQVMDKQGKLMDIEVSQAQLNYDLLKDSFPMIKEARLNELRLQVDGWRALKFQGKKDTLQYLEHWNNNYADAVYTFVQNAQNAYDIAMLKEIYYGAAGGFAAKYPGIFSLCSALQACGAFDLVKTATPAVIGAGNFVGNMIP